MRRKERYITNGALLVGSGVAILDIFLQMKEHNQRGQELTWDNFDGWRTFKKTVIGAAAGSGLGYAVYSYQISQEEKLPFCSDNYLKKILTEEHLKIDLSFFNKVLSHREKVKEWLTDAFRNKLIALPEDAGSFYKRTAIASNYDLDIVLPFKKNSYGSLEEMFYTVFEVIDNKFGYNAKVTKQTKAIGLTFENDGDPIHFDIVPGREINDYRTEKDLNLYVNLEWAWQRSTSFKTNIDTQKAVTSNKPEARRIIKLLKIYKDRNNLPLTPMLIEMCVVKALSDNHFGVHHSDSENLLNSMHFISKKIKQNKIVDISNSNNNLQDRIEEFHRNCIARQLTNDIKKIENNPRYIKEIFDL